MLLNSLTQKHETTRTSASGSVTYDYSHADEKRQPHAKAHSLEGEDAQAA